MGKDNFSLCIGFNLYFFPSNLNRGFLAIAHGIFCDISWLHIKQNCKENEQVQVYTLRL